MLTLDKEFFSPPYYFYLKENKNTYSLYFSVENTLNEARKKDEVVKIPKNKLKKVEDYLKKVLKVKNKTTEKVKSEIEELVDGDGGFMSSKIPILDPKMHPRKTMDQTVAMARQTNDPITRGYRLYRESDMSDAFGYEETKDLNGKETYKYYKDELEMEPEDAKERTLKQGKDYTGKKDKRSKYYKDKNFITRATLLEIQKEKAIKVLEDMLSKKTDTGKSELGSKEKKSIEELPVLVRKSIKNLLRHAENNGISKKDIVKFLKSE
jgi:hypothetical protein